MEAQIKGRLFRQLLVSKASADYESTIHFAGDMDDDGIPDLIIDTANHENVEAPTLYLSRQADQGQLLKVIGMHVIVGC
ncbi:MAG: hypothetical protein V4592_06575 [Bacteroidota bacterium]